VEVVLTVDEKLVDEASAEARRRGTTLEDLIGNYVRELAREGALASGRFLTLRDEIYSGPRFDWPRRKPEEPTK
jgi:hypothetical protein